MNPTCNQMYPCEREAEGDLKLTKEDKGREESDAAVSQRMLTATRSWKRQGIDSSLGLPGGV